MNSMKERNFNYKSIECGHAGLIAILNLQTFNNCGIMFII